MKPAIFLFLAAGLLFGACVLQLPEDAGAGGIHLSFPASTASQALSGTYTTNEARLWLYSSNSLVPNGGTDYFSTAITSSGGSITVEEVPAGTNYRVIVATGQSAGGTFTPLKYGISSPFAVSAGNETGVGLTLKDLAGLMNTAMSGQNVIGVSAADIPSITIFAALSTAVVTFASPISGNGTATTVTSTPVNSLSYGVNGTGQRFVLANTSNGVWSFLSNIVTAAQVGPSGTQPNPTASGAYHEGTAQVYFYQANKEVGGVTANATAGGTSWTKIPLEIEGLTGAPVLDLAVMNTAGTTYGFFATRIIGAFRASSALFEMSPAPEVKDLLDPNNTFLSFIGKDLPFIQALGLSGTTLYIGTKSGVYVGTISSGATALAGSPALLSETKGLNVSKIRVSGGNVAFLAGSDVVVIRGGQSFRLPFMAGFVGTLNDIAWNGNNLLLAGSKGLVQLDVSGL